MADYYKMADELFEYTRFLRRDFHRHPELGFQEVRTAGVVARELNALGLEVTSGIGKTGVVAMLEGSRPGPTVLLRFDMDALPITEETGAPYQSENPGIMHACGHDAHTAVGLTVARMLQETRHELAGSVKFLFQPAEEGMGGAEATIKDGVLENPRPDLALALHVWNDRELGWVGISPGAIMAAGEIFYIKLTGKGGHGALPHLAVDPVLAAAQIVTSLQSIVGRNVSPLHTAVVSVTAIHAGDAFNVIPSFTEMRGTIRTFDPAVRQVVLERFNQIVDGVANAMGCHADIDIQTLTPALINDYQITERVLELASNNPDFSVENKFVTMGSEDMAFILQQVPGCFIFVGSADHEQNLNAPHHHPRFDIDERSLPKAAGLLATATADFLK